MVDAKISLSKHQLGEILYLLNYMTFHFNSEVFNDEIITFNRVWAKKEASKEYLSKIKYNLQTILENEYINTFVLGDN